MVKPLCGNKKPVLFIKTKDFSNSGRTFSIMRCPSTGLLFTSPIPKNINSYYDKKKYDSYKKDHLFLGSSTVLFKGLTENTSLTL